MTGRRLLIASLASVFTITTLAVRSEAGDAATAGFELRDQDRVVLLGNTLVERAQKYGHWESYFTASYPERRIEFRNLGWSGDTVWADSRGIFDPPAKGYERMVEQVKELKPTVLMIAYGGNEAYAGPAGLDPFRQQLEKLLADIDASQTRVLVVTPLAHENLGEPLPNPEQTNKLLQVYSDNLRELAQQRGYHFFDLFAATFHRNQSTSANTHRFRLPLTDNGIHLTDDGYRQLTNVWQRSMQLPELNWDVQLQLDGSAQPVASKATVQDVSAQPAQNDASHLAVRFTVLPERVSNGRNRIRVAGLPEGEYSLTIDGQQVITANSQGWATGLQWNNGPDTHQYDRLREAIIAKNTLYFYQWRPQNITYLFGFRKHEQGQNAKEVAEFDPLIEAQEAKIQQLKQPKPLLIEITPQ